MDAATAAAIQAWSAAIILLLTVILAYIAFKALSSASTQAKAATRSLEEIRQDRHLANLPTLKVSFDVFNRATATTRANVTMLLASRGDPPVFFIRARLNECYDLYKPKPDVVVSSVPVTMIGRNDTFTVPLDLSAFPSTSSAAIDSKWIFIKIDFEGLLGARVTQEWYWAPNEWRGGGFEPELGGGERLILHRIYGTTGAAPGDVDWQREAS